MKEQKIIWLRGLPGCGKTTWAKEEVKKSQGKIKRINKDDLRAMLDVSVHSKANERFVVATRDEIVRKALNDGLSVIIDDTNLDPKHEARMIELSTEYTSRTSKPCDVIKKDFTDVPVLECIKRDAMRTGTAQVGEKVIMGMYNKYLKKPALKYVPPVDGLPKIVICDLDGTAALLNGRNPYDATNCDQDAINEPVRVVINGLKLQGFRVVFMSGREDKYREPTIRFLDKWIHADDYDLFMRKTGDSRKDSIVKRELFDQHIHGKYNPVLWIDDRLQVVQMARNDLGITVFQVDDGLF